MARQLRRILVAVRDLRHAPRNELRKAAAIAAASGARLELFHAITAADTRGRSAGPAARDIGSGERAALAAHAQGCLERFARQPPVRGLAVSCSTSWDYPPHEAIIRRATASRADLVIAATRTRGLRKRLTLRNTDWELIRHCPCPLLLVKSPRAYHKPVVLAAVDPFHAHARPANLDARVLRAAAQLAHALRGSLHLFHAFIPIIQTASFMASEAPVELSPMVERMHEEAVIKVIGRLAERAKIPRARRHVLLGEVPEALARATRRTRASIVVMGAVSRSALKRLFIGEAAERALDQLGCDVLVVKAQASGAAIARKRAPTRTRSGRRPRATHTGPPGIVPFQ